MFNIFRRKHDKRDDPYEELFKLLPRKKKKEIAKIRNRPNEYLLKNPTLGKKDSLPLTNERILELIDGYDAIPNEQRTALDYYVVYQRIVCLNEGVNLHQWDERYSGDLVKEAYKRADQRILKALKESGREIEGI